MKRLVVVFYDAGNPEALQQSLDSFVTMNSSNLNWFKLVVYSQRPKDKTDVKDQYIDVTPYVSSGSKPVCVPCIMKRHRVRYCVVIPPGFVSVAPLWPYLDEFAHNLTQTPDLTHIRLYPDTDGKNLTTNAPLVYHYHTRHIMIGNGNLRRDLPALVKEKMAQTPTSRSGVLKPIVFRKA